MSTAPLPDLTPRQQEIYDLIRDHAHQHGFGVSFRELQAATGITSPNGITCHLKALEKKGRIRRHRGRNRSITVVTDDPTPLLRELVALATRRSVPADERYSHVMYLTPDLFDRLRRLAGEGPG